MLDRLKLLYGDSLDKIMNTTILIIGLGGVGGYSLETLARTGIKKFIIVDGDNVEESNLNRQLMSLNSNIGLPKTEVWFDRIKDINPNCEVICINEFITKSNLDLLFKEKIDYAIDTCDTLDTKKEIIKYCLSNNIKFISSMGMANRVNNKYIKLSTLDKTKNDPLARKLRYILKKENVKGKIPVVYSEELPIKNQKLGSTAHVVGTAGLYITNYIINDILEVFYEK